MAYGMMDDNDEVEDITGFVYRGPSNIAIDALIAEGLPLNKTTYLTLASGGTITTMADYLADDDVDEDELRVLRHLPDAPVEPVTTGSNRAPPVQR